MALCISCDELGRLFNALGKIETAGHVGFQIAAENGFVLDCAFRVDRPGPALSEVDQLKATIKELEDARDGRDGKTPADPNAGLDPNRPRAGDGTETRPLNNRPENLPNPGTGPDGKPLQTTAHTSPGDVTDTPPPANSDLGKLASEVKSKTTTRP